MENATITISLKAYEELKWKAEHFEEKYKELGRAIAEATHVVIMSDKQDLMIATDINEKALTSIINRLRGEGIIEKYIGWRKNYKR